MMWSCLHRASTKIIDSSELRTHMQVKVLVEHHMTVKAVTLTIIHRTNIQTTKSSLPARFNEIRSTVGNAQWMSV